MNRDLLQTLLFAYGPSGREETVRRVIERLLAPYCDEIYSDALGNLIAHKKGEGQKKVMLSAHMDQIGLIVTDIDEFGFLRAAPVGALGEAITLAREVAFENGVRGVTYFETEKEKPGAATFPIMFIDIGAKTGDEAKKKVSIGDMAVYRSAFLDLGARFSCAALDNRLGCYVLIESLMRANTPHDLYAVFTVQEEVGMRGAGPAAFSIQPDFAINVDITITGDTPKAARSSVSLGKGPAIKAMDKSIVVPRAVRSFMEEVASLEGIPVQREVLKFGGTDTGAIAASRAGVIAGCVSIPARYIHTPVETADESDVDSAVALVLAMLGRADLPGENRI